MVRIQLAYLLKVLDGTLESIVTILQVLSEETSATVTLGSLNVVGLVAVAQSQVIPAIDEAWVNLRHLDVVCDSAVKVLAVILGCTAHVVSELVVWVLGDSLFYHLLSSSLLANLVVHGADLHEVLVSIKLAQHLDVLQCVLLSLQVHACRGEVDSLSLLLHSVIIQGTLGITYSLCIVLVLVACEGSEE